jgi:hypothetical protein
MDAISIKVQEDIGSDTEREMRYGTAHPHLHETIISPSY